MAMTVQMVIDGLRADIQLGRYKADDVLVIDWFSYHDIERLASDEDIEMSEDKAREIWAQAVEQIDIQLDWYEPDAIRHVAAVAISHLVANKIEEDFNGEK